MTLYRELTSSSAAFRNGCSFSYLQTKGLHQLSWVAPEGETNRIVAITQRPTCDRQRMLMVFQWLWGHCYCYCCRNINMNTLAASFWEHSFMRPLELGYSQGFSSQKGNTTSLSLYWAVLLFIQGSFTIIEDLLSIRLGIQKWTLYCNSWQWLQTQVGGVKEGPWQGVGTERGGDESYQSTYFT